MTTSAEKINVMEVLSVKVLSTRATARLLFDKAMNKKKSTIVLDFRGIQFASRSFMNELNYLISSQIDVEFELTRMIKQVQTMHALASKPMAKKSTKDDSHLNLVTI